MHQVKRKELLQIVENELREEIRAFGRKTLRTRLLLVHIYICRKYLLLKCVYFKKTKVNIIR